MNGNAIERIHSPVTSRVVRRYYYNGKGYPTKRLAYTAKAKKLLVELVLGPYQAKIAFDPWERDWYELVNRPTEGDEAEQKRAIDARFAEFFPHDGVGKAGIEGCMQDPRPSLCRKTKPPRTNHEPRLRRSN